MEVSTTLMGLLLLALFMGPILYIIIRNKSKEKKRLQEFLKIGASHQMQLDVYEIMKHTAIGLDSKTRQLLVMPIDAPAKAKIISLEGYRHSEVKTEIKREDNYTYIQRVHIAITSGNKMDEIIFYDETVDNVMEAEVQLAVAKKWQNTLATVHV